MITGLNCSQTWRSKLFRSKQIYHLSGISIFFYFKNNVQQTDTEYLVCDYSCLIGEIGGNLGFFLGGSLLALIDLLADNVTLLPWKKTALY